MIKVFNDTLTNDVLNNWALYFNYPAKKFFFFFFFREDKVLHFIHMKCQIKSINVAFENRTYKRMKIGVSVLLTLYMITMKFAGRHILAQIFRVNTIHNTDLNRLLTCLG